MTEYYFLATALPSIQIGAPPEITFSEFDTLIRENLTKEDRYQFYLLRGYYDLMNIRAFWKKKPFESFGTLDEKELEEALLEGAKLPGFVDRFLDQYKDTKERLSHFPQLVNEYFVEAATEAKGFAKEYLDFERELRLVLVALRAKQVKRDLLKELQFEDPYDELVAHILAQKDAPEYEPPHKYQAVKQIFQDYKEEPLELHKALVRYRYEKVQNMVGVQMFSLDRILAYMIRLIMVIKWLTLDAEKGIHMVDQMIKERA